MVFLLRPNILDYQYFYIILLYLHFALSYSLSSLGEPPSGFDLLFVCVHNNDIPYLEFYNNYTQCELISS